MQPIDAFDRLDPYTHTGESIANHEYLPADPDHANVTPASPISSGLFGAPALVDAAALAYLVLDYGWFNFAIQGNIESPAGIIIIPLLWVLTVGEKLFFAAFFVAIGAGIVRELMARREPPRWRAVLASIVLLGPLPRVGVHARLQAGVRETMRMPFDDRAVALSAVCSEATPAHSSMSAQMLRAHPSA